MLVLMHLHSYRLTGHAWFSETRLFMTMIMGGGMIIVMLLYMCPMYTSNTKNIAAIAVAVVLPAGGVFLVRSQVTVSDTDYMEGTIPHHSIAILTSERAQITDLRLIRDIRENGAAKTEAEANARSVPQFEGTPE